MLIYQDNIADLKLSIVDLSSRIIVEERHFDKKVVTIDLSTSSGVYLMIIETPNGTRSQRIVIN